VDDIALTLVSVPNPVLSAGHFNRALLGIFSRAPRVSGLPAKHKLLLIDLIDSCFSGFMSHARKVEAVGPNDPRLAIWTREPVTQVLTADRSGQTAVENPQNGHGMFTWHLLNTQRARRLIHGGRIQVRIEYCGAVSGAAARGTAARKRHASLDHH
jgi:uncharacterized caspase-like protein